MRRWWFRCCWIDDDLERCDESKPYIKGFKRRRKYWEIMRLYHHHHHWWSRVPAKRETQRIRNGFEFRERNTHREWGERANTKTWRAWVQHTHTQITRCVTFVAADKMICWWCVCCLFVINFGVHIVFLYILTIHTLNGIGFDWVDQRVYIPNFSTKVQTFSSRKCSSNVIEKTRIENAQRRELYRDDRIAQSIQLSDTGFLKINYSQIWQRGLAKSASRQSGNRTRRTIRTPSQLETNKMDLDWVSEHERPRPTRRNQREQI